MKMLLPKEISFSQAALGDEVEVSIVDATAFDLRASSYLATTSPVLLPKNDLLKISI